MRAHVTHAHACVFACRQLDCLRQLVVVLCERAQLHDLVHFSYVNLHDEVGEKRALLMRLPLVWSHDCHSRLLLGLPFPLSHQVVGIIESRARGVDLLAHNYYELLYAFHINRHNYRKGMHSRRRRTRCSRAYELKIAFCACVCVCSGDSDVGAGCAFGA